MKGALAIRHNERSAILKRPHGDVHALRHWFKRVSSLKPRRSAAAAWRLWIRRHVAKDQGVAGRALAATAAADGEDDVHGSTSLANKFQAACLQDQLPSLGMANQRLWSERRISLTGAAAVRLLATSNASAQRLHGNALNLMRRLRQATPAGLAPIRQR
jgi:hypothetical protein